MNSNGILCLYFIYFLYIVGRSFINLVLTRLEYLLSKYFTYNKTMHVGIVWISIEIIKNNKKNSINFNLTVFVAYISR